MGTYRPYCKTLYWTCWRAATFAIFAFLHISHVSHFRMFRVSVHLAYFTFQIPHIFMHLTYCTHFAIPHSSYFAHSHILRVSHFRIFRISHFCILVFFALWHVLPHASLGSIAFCLHVLSSSSKVHWCIFHFVSLALHHMSLHSHLCSLILLCVYITSPLYV
jgi:hypothetical protein